jgi:hypothetical protein
LFNTKIYILADQYGVSDLKDLALQKFESYTSQDFEEFMQAVTLPWENTPPGEKGLRNFMAKESFKK